MIQSVTIRQATKAGIAIWRVGGVADLSFPTSKTRRGRVQGDGNICPTLMANNQDIFKLEADAVKKYRIRKLTPRECWRLMGFSDEDFDKAAAVNSNTQLYAQAGNSIVVNVLEAIFSQMIEPVAADEIPEEVAVEEMVIEETAEEEIEKLDIPQAEIESEEPENQRDLLGEFKEMLMNSEKVKLCGSINSGNYMIHIDDAVDLLRECLAG